MDHFTPVDTLDTSTFLHSVVQPNNSFALQWLMPVTGFQNNGQPATPPEFDSEYGLYLTVDASGILGQTTPTPIAEQFTSINVTLWADPKDDAGTASSTVQSGAVFSGNTANDIVLATGTMVSGQMSVDASGVRMATDVEQLTPTLEGTLLLGGSIKPGDLLTEHFTTQPNEFMVVTPGDGTSVDLVNGGSATVTLTSADTDNAADVAATATPGATLRIPSGALQLSHSMRFMHHHHHW
jgi:hypothetical protein